MISSLRVAALAVGGLVAIVAGSAAWSQSGSFAGDSRDPLTGYPCLSPFCEAVSLPGTDCLCQKDNPGATKLSELKLTCTVGVGMKREQCPVQPKFGK